MNKTTQQLLISAAIASIVGIGSSSTTALAKSKAKKMSYHCDGANGCKGQGACKGADNACKGQNGCKGKGFTMTKNKKECDDMKTAMNEKMEKPMEAPATAPEEKKQ